MFWFISAIAALILFVITIFVILVVIGASKINDQIEKEDNECLKRQGIL